VSFPGVFKCIVIGTSNADKKKEVQTTPTMQAAVEPEMDNIQFILLT
jgi:hypothetical protein